MEGDRASVLALASPSSTTQNGDTTRSLSKACTACHKRKLRCDAAAVGIPCSRCAEKGCADACVRVERRYKRRRPSAKVQAEGYGRSRIVPASPAARDGLRYGRNGRDSLSVGPGNGLQTPVEAGSVPAESLSESGEAETSATEIRICRELIAGQPISRAMAAYAPVTPASRELVQYHHSQHYLTIIGEALGRDKHRRLTRVVLDGMRPRAGWAPAVGPDGRRDPLSGLDNVDRDYLIKKGVLVLPPRECIETLFKCYFDNVYPFAPVLDKVEFLREFYNDTFSYFVVYAVLASGTSYAPQSVITACGCRTRAEALASFYKKATLLYDFECERRQMRMLQGSAILGSTPCTYEADKEFRYWFHNAVRLAVRMGLHQRELATELDANSYRTCKRVWWYLYSRDVHFSLIGVENMRLLTDGNNSTRPLTMDDWEVDDIPYEYSQILEPTSRAQKLAFIESGVLVMLASSCHAGLQDGSTFRHLQDDGYPFATWRASLLEQFGVAHDPAISSDVALTVLVAQSYRVECILFRLMRTCLQHDNPVGSRLAKQRLRGAMFELDTIIGRTMTKGTINKFPLSFISNIPFLLALHIEMALDESEPGVVRDLSRTYIRQNMMLLRHLSDFPVIQRSIPVFEWVLQQKCFREDAAAAITEPLPEGASPAPAPAPAAEPYFPAFVDGQSTEGQAKDVRYRLDSVASDMADSLQDSETWLQDFIGQDFLDNLYYTSFL